jgi:hypothetical protein
MEGCPWAIQKFGEPPGYFLFRDLFRYGTASDPGFLDRMSSPQAISVSVHLTRIGDLPPGPPVELIQDPLDVRLVATRLGSALTHGVPLRLNCFSPCRVAATLRIPRAVAHRYRLRTRTVGALTRRLPAESLRTVRVRFTDRARHALRPAKRVRLRVPVTVDPKQGVTLRKTLRPTLTRG